MGGINIDSIAPSVTINGVASGAIYTLGSVPAATCAETDNLSGLDASGCVTSLTGGTANGVGTYTFTATATATDRAGNTTVKTVTYRAVYRFDGFLQPINDTAHQTGVATSVFKSGSTVPAKLQLKRADGSVVQATSQPEWLTPQRGSATAASVDETLYSESATT